MNAAGAKAASAFGAAVFYVVTAATWRPAHVLLPTRFVIGSLGSVAIAQLEHHQADFMGTSPASARTQTSNLKSKTSDRACPERSRRECPTHSGLLSTPMRLGGFGADHVIEGQQHNGAQDRHDEACGLSFLIPAQCSAGIGCNERSCDADQHGDDDSTRVLAGHEKFRYRTDYQADQQCPYEMHPVSSSARKACGRSQLFVGRQTSGPRV